MRHATTSEQNKTQFISGENPCLPVDRDTTVPVAFTQTLSRDDDAFYLFLQKQNLVTVGEHPLIARTVQVT